MLRMMLLLLMLPVMGQAFTEARLLSKSKSGITVQFNLGTHDRISRGDFAVIAKQVDDFGTKKLRVIPVARARNIKINSDSSTWILYKVYDQSQIQRGDKYIVLSETIMTNGQRDVQPGNTTHVIDLSKNDQRLGYENNDRDRLAKRSESYDVIAPTKSIEAKHDGDLETKSLEKWELVGGSDEIHRRGHINRVATKKEYQRHFRLETFEQHVAAYFKRVNEPDFSYDRFYEASRRSEFSNETKVMTDIETEYNKFLESQSKRASADAKLLRTVLEKGESWSEDYSDEELRRVLNEVSVLHETDRRQWVGANPNRYSVSFDYGYILTDAQTDSDSFRREDQRSYEVDFEAIPVLGHKALERFTLNGSVRMSYNAFEADGSNNADMRELSATLGANWYPLYAPYATESAVLFMGAYIRNGTATVRAVTAGQKANYTVLSIPGLRAGMKYLLKNDWGLRLILSMETLKLERYQASELNPVLPDDTNLVEAKFAFGVTYGF